jgi:hypothetical protein
MATMQVNMIAAMALFVSGAGRELGIIPACRNAVIIWLPINIKVVLS